MVFMKSKELDFFLIDGKYYGGDQNWHTHHMMKLGGCSAVCACEACISLAKDFERFRPLYPFDPHNVTKDDFISFFEIVFKYIYPGIGGLASIIKFEKMLGDYVSTTDADVVIEGIEGTKTYNDAENFIIDSIDRGVPVMYLLLKHASPEFDEYEWHWFNLTGYEEKSDGMYVKAATWGAEHCLNLARMWDTGKAKRGGMVRMV